MSACTCGAPETAGQRLKGNVRRTAEPVEAVSWLKRCCVAVSDSCSCRRLAFNTRRRVCVSGTVSQLDVDTVDVHVRVAARAGPRLGVRRTSMPPSRSDISAVHFDVDGRTGRRHGSRTLLPPITRHRQVVVVVDVEVVVVARRRPLSAMVLVYAAVAMPVVGPVVWPVPGRRPTDVVRPAAAGRLSAVPDRITVGRVERRGWRRRGGGDRPGRRRRGGVVTALTFYRARRATRRPQRQW